MFPINTFVNIYRLNAFQDKFSTKAFKLTTKVCINTFPASQRFQPTFRPPSVKLTSTRAALRIVPCTQFTFTTSVITLQPSSFLARGCRVVWRILFIYFVNEKFPSLCPFKKFNFQLCVLRRITCN